MPASPSAVSAPPPTLNNLGPHQRTRLLRSTRKLEALLGTTPYLLEPTLSGSRPGPSSPPSSSAWISPKGARHEGLPLGASRFSFPYPNVQHTKLSGDDGYVLVHRAHNPSFIEKPFSSSGPEFSPDILRESEDSPFGDKPRLLLKKNSVSKESRDRDKSRSKAADKPKDTKPKKETTPPVSHPLVLSLLTVPVSQFDTRLPTHPFPTSSPSSTPARSRGPNRDAPLPSPTFAPNSNGQILTLPTTPTTPNTPTPLTPLSATYYSNQSDGSERERERQRDVRRKKFAKLARTLGENVPPELVFPTQSADAKEQSSKMHRGRDLDTTKPMSRSRPSESSSSTRSTPKSQGGSQSQARSQATRASTPSAESTSSQSKYRSPPASAPPIVIIGPPPPPGARRKRRSPTSSHNQNDQSEAHSCAGLVIPPPPSIPAPLPPSMLVERYRLEREKSRSNLNQAQLAPTSTLGDTHRPRTLSLGSGIDLLDRYWEAEIEIEDGYDGSWKVGEVEEAEPPASANTPALSIHPEHNQVQFPTLPSPTKHHPTSYRTHRTVLSLPSPHDVCFPSAANKPTTFIASDGPPPPLLRRKSSKSKAKAAPSSKGEVKKSHGVEVGIQRSVELDDGTGRLRSETPQSSEGGHTSRPLLSPRECGRRKEHEWSGEWNRRDMDEVVKALRGLKSR